MQRTESPILDYKVLHIKEMLVWNSDSETNRNRQSIQYKMNKTKTKDLPTLSRSIIIQRISNEKQVLQRFLFLAQHENAK